MSSSILRNSSATNPEKSLVVFQFTEDIYNISNIQLLVKKGEEEQIPLSKPRKFISYCYELCGRLNIPFNILSFKLNEIDLTPKFQDKVRSSCVINVIYLMIIRSSLIMTQCLFLIQSLSLL